MAEAYDDGTIVCGADGLEIHSYYFPFGTKSVSYAQIQGLQALQQHPGVERRQGRAGVADHIAIGFVQQGC